MFILLPSVWLLGSHHQSLNGILDFRMSWCRRIFPIQETCSLNEKEPQTVVSKLVFQFMNDNQHKVSHPVKFMYTTAFDVLGKANRPVEALDVFHSMQIK
ncbi:pentatricopeptide repeat-containing protein [Quercus suber]|uniref:Pentatricopeptide repeat-containing protein n=1 Tax=Quercus suber TaxID=58331 RepID=A0AAW0KUD6_QUESU